MKLNFAIRLGVAMAALVAMTADAGSPKLGWAGSNASDHNASNASWYYRWWHTIPSDASGSLAEFVPLIKFPTAQNLPNNLGHVASLPNVDTLLVLNEPERESQSDRTVAEALALWPTIQSTLPNHRLVGPGIGDDPGGRAWMADFMSQVDALNGNADPDDDIRLDAVAFHWYGASSPNAVNAANSFLNRVDWYHQEYNRPVWITEFAMHDWEGNDSVESMIQANADFLEIVIPELEARSYVERYSYYNWFDDAMVFEDPNRMPTVIGDQYVGTLLPGDTRDLAGVSLGTDVVYLRGGSLTNTGAATPEAMRSIDALGGLSVISADADWANSFRRDSYVRVRDGATLRKEGFAQVGFSGAISNQGTLHVIEGELLFEEGSYSGGGAIRVDEGATLNLILQGGRGTYTISNTQIDVEGRVDGPVRIAAGSTLTPLGEVAEFGSTLAVRDSVVEVGGPGFNVLTPSAQPVTAGLQLNYDAALDTPGDNVWSDAVGSSDAFTFAQNASPVAVNEASFPGVTAAYSIDTTGGAEGLNQYFESLGPRSRQDATFEIAFLVEDAAAGGDQVLMEVGGAGRGVAFVLNDGVLTFNVDGDGSDINLTHPVAAGWRHAVGVIDLAGGGDTVTLYLDGQQVGTLSGQNITDWAGGNIAGVGSGANSVTGVASGTGNAFHGDLALVRYYQNTAFDSADALQNYQALANAPASDPTLLSVAGDLLAENGGELRLDIRADGDADKIAIAGALSIADASLVVGLVGAGEPTLGDAFDLFDFASAAGSFDSITLPGLGEGLSWRADRLTQDGVIEVVLVGDFNADGVVDGADYTVWRDTEGEGVSPYTGGDSNGDGLVDAIDLNAWRANYGATAPVAQSIPEPTAALLAGLALLAARRRPR